MEFLRESIQRNKRLMPLLIIAVVFEIMIIGASTTMGMLLVLATALILLLFIALVFKVLGLEEATMLLILIVPLSFYFANNYLYQIITSSKYSTYVELAFMLSVLVANYLRLKKTYDKRGKRRFALFTEGYIVLLMFLGNLFTFLIFKYDSRIFILASLFYLKYIFIVLIIFYSNISFDTLKRPLKILSILFIANFIVAILQFVFGQTFLTPFLGAYFVQSRNSIVRCVGIFSWPTELGAVSGVYFIVYYFYGKATKSIYMYAIAGMNAVCILLAQARLSFAIIVLVMLLSNIKRLSSLFRYVFGLITIILIINSFIGLDQVVGNTIDEYSNIEAAPRLYYTIKGLDVFEDNMIFGIGFERFGTLWARNMDGDTIFTRYGIKQYKSGSKVLDTTDAFVAKLLPEFGLFGGLLFIWFIIMLFLKALRIKNKYPQAEICLYLLVFYSIYLLNSANSMFSLNLGPLFWVGAGFIVKYNYLMDEKNDVPRIGSILRRRKVKNDLPDS